MSCGPAFAAFTMLIDGFPCYRLGIGAPLPTKAADGSWNRAELDSNDKLRKQLLGKNYKRVIAAGAGASVTGALGKPDVRATSGFNPKEVDDEHEVEEDEGRTSTVTKHRSRKRKAVVGSGQSYEETTTNPDESQGYSSSPRESTSTRQPPRSKASNKATSFLDEILADRSKRRKKK